VFAKNSPTIAKHLPKPTKSPDKRVSSVKIKEEKLEDYPEVKTYTGLKDYTVKKFNELEPLMVRKFLLLQDNLSKLEKNLSKSLQKDMDTHF